MSADNSGLDQEHTNSIESSQRAQASESVHSNHIPVAGLALFVFAYVLAGGLGQGLSLIPGVAIIFWPPAGVFVGTLLMNARRTWPWWIAAGCAAELTCNALWFNNSIPFSLLYFGANALTAFTAAWLVERTVHRPLKLETLKEVSVLTFLAAGVAPLASATIIATTDAIIGKHSFTTAWLLVWIGDGTGLLVSTPLTLVAIDTWRHRQHVSRRDLLESVSMFLLLIVVGFLAMRGYLPTVYLLMPIVLWIAARFLIRGIAVALPLVAIMTAIFTAMGSGEFAGSSEAMQGKILSLQVFLGVCAVSALIVAAVSAERQQVAATLQRMRLAADLLQSEERFRLAVEATGVGIFDFDPVSQRQSFSAEALRLWGFEPGVEPTPKLVLNTVHPDDRARMETVTLGSLDPMGSGKFAIEHRLLRPDGSVRWLSSMGQTQFVGSNGSRRAVRSVGTMLDITERKRAEIELLQSEAFIRGVLNSLPEHVAVLDSHGVIVSVNDPWKKFASENGGNQATVSPMGTNYLELFSQGSTLEEEHAREAFDCLRDLLAGKVDAIAVEYPCHAPDDQRWFLMNARRVRDSGNVVVSHLDVTARKTAELKVRESEARIQQALRASRSFTFEWEPETDIVRRSASCADILQLSGDEAINDSGQRFFDRVMEEDRRGFTEVISKLTPTAGSYTTIYRVRVGEGREVILEESGQGSFDASGKLVRLVGVTTDVTARKHAEAALKESDRRKDEFLATLSHELRNPLATIRSGLEVFRLTPDNAKVVAETRDLMQRQVTHLVALVDDLLEVSRISRGKLKLRRETVDIAQAVESAIEACQPLMQEAGHELSVELPRNAVHVAGDPHRVMQMFSNLLNNAAKYTPPGGQISIAAVVQESEVSISVKDTGVGIAKKQLPRIFELFAQVKNESSAYAGLGIGLSLVKSLAEMHGGSVSVISDGKNKGSTFTVRLPVCEAKQASHSPALVAGDTSVIASRRVLVVDDNVGAARTLSIVVKMLGNEVCTAYNGQDALEKGHEFQPEIVIMDIGMPVMDGYAAARAIREVAWGKNACLIALTGWGQEDDKQRTKEAGFNRHLVKPVEPSVIREILAELSTTGDCVA